MAVSTGALSLLGESTDWLKDSDEVSLSEYRLQVLSCLGSCWRHPEDEPRFAKFEENLILLFQGLFYNKLYPQDLLFIHNSPTDPRNYLPRPERLAEDLPRLSGVCATNRLGIGEVHVLYATTALCRRVFVDAQNDDDLSAEGMLGKWLLEREVDPDDPEVGEYSEEAVQRYRSLRATRAMKLHGLSDDGDESQMTNPTAIDIVSTLVATGAEGLSRYCPREHWLALLVLEFATAMEEHMLARSQARPSRDPRTAEEIAKGLLHCMRQVAIDEEMGMARRLRLADLLLTVLVRAMANVEAHVGVMLYSKLRSKSGRRPRISHKAMFEALPDDEARIHLLNFLYREGDQNPVAYINRFAGYFRSSGLRFGSKETGFSIKPETS